MATPANPYAARFSAPIRGEWAREAACAGQWELMEGPDVAAAKRLCFDVCTVRAECRAWALLLTPLVDPGGVIAGLTSRDRCYVRARASGLKSAATIRARARENA